MLSCFENENSSLTLGPGLDTRLSSGTNYNLQVLDGFTFQKVKEKTLIRLCRYRLVCALFPDNKNTRGS